MMTMISVMMIVSKIFIVDHGFRSTLGTPTFYYNPLYSSNPGHDDYIIINICFDYDCGGGDYNDELTIPDLFPLGLSDVVPDKETFGHEL